MIQFIQDGGSINHTPTVDLDAGMAVVVGEMVGITKVPIRADTVGTLFLTGVYDIDKEGLAPEAINEGVKLYLDEAGQFGSVDDAGGTRKYLGTTTQVSELEEPTVRFRLNH